MSVLGEKQDLKSPVGPTNWPSAPSLAASWAASLIRECFPDSSLLQRVMSQNRDVSRNIPAASLGANLSQSDVFAEEQLWVQCRGAPSM